MNDGQKRDGGCSLSLQCCRYDGLRFAAEVGRPIVHAGEVYSGGEVIRDGRQTGFDLISDIKKIEAEDGSWVALPFFSAAESPMNWS